MDKLKNILNMPLIKLLKETFQEWNEDKAPRLAAALAYYTAFSIAPLLIIIIAVAGLVFGQEAVQGKIQYEIQGAVGSEAAGAIQEMLVNFRHPDQNILATIIGLVTLLLGAAGLFGQLQDALNTVWEVAPKPNQGILAMIRQRFISFTMVLGIGFVLIVSLVISTVTAAVGAWFSSRFPAFPLIEVLNFVISFAVLTLLFAAIYKVLPDVKIAWRDVWMGAAVTAALFTIGKFALGLYLGNSTIASGYGAAGSFVVLLLWIFYSAQILLFGAEFTQVYARTYGSRIEPSSNAVMLTEADRAHQGIPHAATVQAIAAADKHDQKKKSRVEVQSERRLEAEQQRLAAAQPVWTAQSQLQPAPESPRLGAIVLGICAALATFVIGFLISTDQKQTR